MRWFKHYSDNYRGRSVHGLFDEFGHVGVACYYIILELCAEKLNKSSEKDLEEKDLIFGFSERFLRQNLRISSTKLQQFLNICSTFGLFSYKSVGKNIEIKMPILLELLDSDFKKTRSRRESDAFKTPLDRDIDIDKDIYIEKIIKSGDLTHSLICLWNEHATNLSKVNKTNKVRDKKINKIFSNLTQQEWVEVIEKINNSDFCLGKSKQGWRASFDWLLQPDTYLKVLEGKYDNKKTIIQSAPTSNRDKNEMFARLEKAKQATGEGLQKASEDPTLKKIMDGFIKTKEFENEK